MRKIALVTGSAQRLGKEIALGFARQGYFCWVHYQNSQDHAEDTLELIRQAGGEGNLIKGQQNSLEEVQEMAQKILAMTPHLDCLVNNVGIYSTQSILDFSPHTFKEIIEVNLLGCYYWLYFLSPHLNANSHIINIGYAGIGRLSATEDCTAYTISKTGLHQLSMSYAKALASRGITVNTISPGQLDNSIDLPSDLPAYIPMGRPGTCEDIVETVRFLTSGKAQYITGQNIEVSGGFHLSLQSHLS